MRFLIQRVSRASVAVNGTVVGSIHKGFLVFVGVCEEDTREQADKLVRKMAGLRIFEDENGKANLALKDVGGKLLIISQFTLYADCRKGNRPSFVRAGAPDHARELYAYILAECRKIFPVVEQGEFGAHMDVKLENDGPFTVLLDTAELS